MTTSILALDTASPQVSVAVAVAGRVRAAGSAAISRSSEELLPLVERCLEEAGVALREIGGLVALAGPGSFTGIRVGLATALGLHQALGVRATALPSLDALAAWAAPALEADGPDTGDRPRLVAAVDALRGEWVSQAFAGDMPPGAVEEARRRPASELLQQLVDEEGTALPVVGFGVAALALHPEAPARLRLLEAGPLAPAAALLAHTLEEEGSLVWDPQALTRPLYFRPPAVTLPKGS